MAGSVETGHGRLSALGLSGRGGRDPVLTGITADSRAVKPGMLFAALPGVAAHGAGFVEQALAAGAAAVLTDADGARLWRGLRRCGSGRSPR